MDDHKEAVLVLRQKKKASEMITASAETRLVMNEGNNLVILRMIPIVEICKTHPITNDEFDKG